jgi:hypothetical protein
MFPLAIAYSGHEIQETWQNIPKLLDWDLGARHTVEALMEACTRITLSSHDHLLPHFL